MKSQKFFILFLLGTLLLGACSVQKNLPETGINPKSLSPPADKALVYLVRPSTIAFAIDFHPNCDGVALGSVGAKRYVYTIVDPGKHNFVVYAEKDTSMELEIESGKTYYIKLSPQMGVIKARVKMEVLSEEEGKYKLAKCKLSKYNTFNN